MSASLETVLVSVWQQALIDKKKIVDLDGETYPIRQTSKSKLKQIDFRFEAPRVARVGTESEYKITVGKTSAGRKAGNAILGTREIRCGRCRGKSSHL
jgi:hypothetical protein